MTIDEETLMAFADGELDPIGAKRVERAMADDPALADAVAAHRALRARVGAAFNDILDAPPPDRLTALLATNVVPMARPPQRREFWVRAASLAACLIAGVAVGRQWQGGPVASTATGIVASGKLAHALDTQLASASGETRVLVSFRDRDGSVCRVFAAPALDGIACRDRDAWALRRTQTPDGAPSTAGYRQAGSSDAALLASAQDMMAGSAFDDATERATRDRAWRQAAPAPPVAVGARESVSQASTHRAARPAAASP